MTQELSAIWSKINELDSEKHEHELVRELLAAITACALQLQNAITYWIDVSQWVYCIAGFRDDEWL